MLMAAGAGAATHMGGSVHSSSSISPPPLCHPVVLVPSHHHQHQVLYDDLDLGTPSPTTPAATASPPRLNHNHSHLRPAASRQRARAGKPQRRPRPSRKQPTTYISADAASFRRMVHQVTGADDDDALLLHLHGGPAASAPERLLCRQAQGPPRSRAGLGLTTTETMLLPTLDTSAFLMLGAAAGGATGTSRGGGGGGAAPARPYGAFCRHGSAMMAVDPGAPALQVKTEEACGGAGAGGRFPSLESWDEDDALFLPCRSPSVHASSSF